MTLEEKLLKRRKFSKKLTNDQLLSKLKQMVLFFTEDWILSDRDHPVQALLNRKDTLSTIELFSLGDALEHLSKINPDWVKRKVSEIKDPDRNIRTGALFELTGLNFLTNKEQTVEPTQRGYPGVDGIITLKSGYRLNLSMKNYGISVHNSDFLATSSSFLPSFTKICSGKGINFIKTAIDFPSIPKDQDWLLVEKFLPDILDNFEQDALFVHFTDNHMDLYVDDLRKEHKDLFPEKFNFQITMSSVFHKNEKDNLLSKLSEAADNLEKKVFKQKAPEEHDLYMIFIHLYQNASCPKCVDWAEWYFTEFPDSPLDGIIFYQPSCVIDPANNTSHLQHYFKIVESGKFKALKEKDPTINVSFTIPVGIISPEPARWIIHAQNPSSGEIKQIDITDRYVYQTGHLYEFTPFGQEGRSSKLSQGIFRHAVMEIRPDYPPCIYSGPFSADDELLIL
ncbi:hypothetical protein JW979_02920 [bacterium]|nr:hypothetical protein [candidate division CSSED10-310 bacterium]